MFKTAARKLAHNSTIPSLAGKQDLRPLQDLITAEKAVLNSFQRLSGDFARASEALRLWGQGEGDDLGDILTASNALFLHFSAALSGLATNESGIRDCMKSIRTREEQLDQRKRERKSMSSDEEAAERKMIRMSKTSPEHKNLPQQTELWNELREKIRLLDAEIMAEEAALGDFKRFTVRDFMNRKFGGLLECCEKGRIVAEQGKLVISEIPSDPTQPGLPRAYYAGHARTEFFVSEAARQVSEVGFSEQLDHDPLHQSTRLVPGAELPPLPSSPQAEGTASDGPTNSNPYVRDAGVDPQPGHGSSSTPNYATYPGLPIVYNAPIGFSVSPYLPDTSQSHMNAPSSVNEFGIYASPPSNQPNSFSVGERDRPDSTPGGRFATFPVKAMGPRPPPGGAQGNNMTSTNPYLSSPPIQEGDRPPSLDISRGNDESFSSSIASALGGYTMDGSSGAGSSRIVAPRGVPPARDVKGGADFGPQRYSPPPPMYTPLGHQGLPMGAAPPQLQDSVGTPMNGAGKDVSRQPAHDDADDGLAYMSPSRVNDSVESVHNPSDRKVRFGEVSDISDAEDQRRISEEQRHGPTTSMRSRVPVPLLNENEYGSQNGRTSSEVHRSQPASPTEFDAGIRGPSPSEAQSQPRPPTPPATEALMDERALNAAAAREVSRELDALMISSPPNAAMESNDHHPPSPFSTRPAYGASPYQKRSVSPLPPLNTIPTISTMRSQPTSPRLEGTYVRHRDRTANSPAVTVQESVPAPSSPTPSNHDQRPSLSQPRTSPTPSDSGTPFRTPMSTPSGMPPSGSMYNLPATAGSGTSFSGTAPRTISAAAFRRPQTQPRHVSGDSAMGLGAVETTPLNVKKRALPASPHPSYSSLPQGHNVGMSMRSVSAGGVGQQDRPVSHHRRDGEEEDFDYISAYTDNPDRVSGYGSGRFATSLDEPHGNSIL